MEDLGLRRSFWAGRKVLLTGHTGFKGSWLALWLQELGASVAGLALAPNGSPALYSLLEPWGDLRSHLVDLRDLEGVRGVLEAERPQVVLHLAAQALVPVGFSQPLATLETNLMGTAHLLEAIRILAAAGRGPEQVVVVTTDKVYANDGTGTRFVESAALGGEDPYSASKACCEHLCTAYRESFLRDRGVALRTARAGNVIGGGDFSEYRLLPDVFRALERGEAVQLRRPGATRPWQHVLEPLCGYLRLVEALAEEPARVPAALNFGPHSEACVPVRDVVEKVFELWGAGTHVGAVDASIQEKQFLELDASAADACLGWRPRLSLDDALSLTVSWTRSHASGEGMRAVTLGQIRDYSGEIS